MNNSMILFSVQLLSANNVSSSWKNILEGKNHQINYHLYNFHHLPTADCTHDVRRGVVVITTAQLHSTKPELRFCAGSNPVHGVSEIRDGENLWQWSRLKLRLNAFLRSAIPQRNNSSNNILKSSLSCFISSSTRIMFLTENSNSSMILYFLINLLLTFLSLNISFLYVKPLLVRLLDLFALPSPSSDMTISLALCLTHCQNDLSPDMIDITFILVLFSWCWSLLTVIDRHLVIPFGFLLSVPTSTRSASNLSPSDNLPTRLTKSSPLHTTPMLLHNSNLCEHAVTYSHLINLSIVINNR